MNSSPLILGRAEINIKPWEVLRSELKDGNGRVRWMDREPYAYWKGNPAVATTRQDLLRCNVSEAHDWNARLYAQVGIDSVYESGSDFLLMSARFVGLAQREQGRVQRIGLGEPMHS